MYKLPKSNLLYSTFSNFALKSEASIPNYLLRSFKQYLLFSIIWTQVTDQAISEQMTLLPSLNTQSCIRGLLVVHTGFLFLCHLGSQYRKKESGPIMSNFLGWIFHVLGVKIYLKNILATTLKSYIKWFLFIFFLKKFEKVEKTGIISTKFSLRFTPSVILGIQRIVSKNVLHLYLIGRNFLIAFSFILDSRTRQHT